LLTARADAAQHHLCLASQRERVMGRTAAPDEGARRNCEAEQWRSSACRHAFKALDSDGDSDWARARAEAARAASASAPRHVACIRLRSHVNSPDWASPPPGAAAPGCRYCRLRRRWSTGAGKEQAACCTRVECCALHEHAAWCGDAPSARGMRESSRVASSLIRRLTATPPSRAASLSKLSVPGDACQQPPLSSCSMQDLGSSVLLPHQHRPRLSVMRERRAELAVRRGLPRRGRPQGSQLKGGSRAATSLLPSLISHSSLPLSPLSGRKHTRTHAHTRSLPRLQPTPPCPALAAWAGVWEESVCAPPGARRERRGVRRNAGHFFQFAMPRAHHHQA